MTSPRDGDLVSALDAIQGVKIAVIGDVMLDRYHYGAAERLSPEAPVPVFTSHETVEMPGGAANVAMNLSALGASPRLAGAVGVDAEGERLRRLLPSAHLFDGHQTTLKERFVASGHHLLRQDRDGDPRISPRALRTVCGDLIDWANALVIADYDKGFVPALSAVWAITRARDRGIPSVVDPAAVSFERYEGASVLTPNETELVAGGPDRGATCLVITKGRGGITLRQEGAQTDLPARCRQVYDVAGAGDTVTAVIGACLGAGVELETACRLANEAAGLAVGKRGTATASAEELRTVLAGSRYESAENLCTRVGTWRAFGLLVGFTNGVFDLLHPGHLHLLRRAKAVCDRLVVALNSDASAARLKPGRPLQDLAARIQVVEALDCVDAVTSFEAPAPLALIERIRPDVLIKGGDYHVQDVIGREFAGRVVIVPLLEGYSTTAAVIRARRAAA